MKWGYSGMTKPEIRKARKEQLYKEQLNDYTEAFRSLTPEEMKQLNEAIEEGEE